MSGQIQWHADLLDERGSVVGCAFVAWEKSGSFVPMAGESAAHLRGAIGFLRPDGSQVMGYDYDMIFPATVRGCERRAVALARGCVRRAALRRGLKIGAETRKEFCHENLQK